MSGADIKRERERLGVRQYKVASALGVSPPTLCNIESGRHRLREGEAEAIIAVVRSLAASEPRRPENRFLDAARRVATGELAAVA